MKPTSVLAPRPLAALELSRKQVVRLGAHDPFRHGAGTIGRTTKLCGRTNLTFVGTVPQTAAVNGTLWPNAKCRGRGVPAILGELYQVGLLEERVRAVHARSLADWLNEWDVRSAHPSIAALELFHAAPGGVRTVEPFSTSNRWSSLDTDGVEGSVRDAAHYDFRRAEPPATKATGI